MVSDVDSVFAGYTHCSFCCEPLDQEPKNERRNEIEKIFKQRGVVEVIIPNCGHRFHKICLSSLVRKGEFVDDNIFCPIDECLGELGSKASFQSRVKLLVTSARKKSDAIQNTVLIAIIAIGVQIFWSFAHIPSENNYLLQIS